MFKQNKETYENINEKIKKLNETIQKRKQQ